MVKKILNVPKIKQLPLHCGVASLNMILEYNGIKINQEELREKYFDLKNIERIKGVLDYEIISAAQKFGLNATCYEFLTFVDIINFIGDNLPIIAITGYKKFPKDRHCSVIRGYKTKKTALYINDPEDIKRNKWDYNKFKDLWLMTNNRGIVIRK